MYCISCGTAVTPGLSYCNHCGVKLPRAKEDNSSELKLESLVFTIAAVFICGLGAIVGLMAAAKNVLGEPFILLFMMLSFLIMCVVEGVFISMLFSRKRKAKEAAYTTPFEDRGARELNDPNARALPEPALGITEHTTRTLEPVASQGKTE